MERNQCNEEESEAKKKGTEKNSTSAADMCGYAPKCRLSSKERREREERIVEVKENLEKDL